MNFKVIKTEKEYQNALKCLEDTLMPGKEQKNEINLNFFLF